MTTNHIDQLAEWWENAEKGTPREGDTYIARFPGRDGYETGVVDSDGLPTGMLPDTRILARAPKPKPAWHDAVAVMARCSNAPEDHREPFIRSEATPDVWIGEGGCGYTDDLRDVTPLIEAKVTDEMVDRVREYKDFTGRRYFASREGARHLLAIALGLETE